MSAGLESRVRVRRTSGHGPTCGLLALADHAGSQPIGDVSKPATFPLAGVALDQAPGRPGHSPRAAIGEDALLRLALWLAEVAAEAALAVTAPEASSTPGSAAPPRLGRSADPPIAESAH